MGNVDKGLRLLNGRPLAAWVLERIAGQAAEILINANRNRDAYAALGHRVIGDHVGGFAGPLAGMHAGLSEAAHELVAFVPCDTPLLPEDLVPMLLAPLHDEQVDLSVARTGSQAHNVICVARKRLLPHLTDFLEQSGRKVDAWYATLSVAQVSFDDQAGAFRNANTPEELQAIERDQSAASRK
jgi:molybdopterin-guanine dinucleotide biosynthesis protein A